MGRAEVQDMAGIATFPRLQAGAVRQRKQPSLLWTPETLTAEDIEDEVHARWLDEIENGERPESGSRFVRSTRQALLDQVQQLLADIAAERQGAGSPARRSIPTTRISCTL
ncbi:MAG: hypothetical protein R3E95_13445 [Thiolinea sp.]